MTIINDIIYDNNWHDRPFIVKGCGWSLNNTVKIKTQLKMFQTENQQLMLFHKADAKRKFVSVHWYVLCKRIWWVGRYLKYLCDVICKDESLHSLQYL